MDGGVLQIGIQHGNLFAHLLELIRQKAGGNGLAGAALAAENSDNTLGLFGGLALYLLGVILRLLLIFAVTGAAAGAAVAAAGGKISAKGFKIRHILHVFCLMLLLEACLLFFCHDSCFLSFEG